MFCYSTHAASFFPVLMAALVFSLSQVGVAAAQGNISLGTGALQNNTRAASIPPVDSMRSLATALAASTPPVESTRSLATPWVTTTPRAESMRCLATPRATSTPPAGSMRFRATPWAASTLPSGPLPMWLLGTLTNATASGANAFVNVSNKIRLGSGLVTVIEGQVMFTASSDKTQKENFQPVDGEEVLGKIRGFELSSWNFGHDPKKFRHYGPMAQDFYAAFGHDGLGQIGSEKTINSGDLAGILMIAVQALEKRTAELKQKEAQMAVLESKVEELKAKHAYFETVVARLEALELRKNHPIQITAEKSLARRDGRSDAVS
jgi:hypothetical protein